MQRTQHRNHLKNPSHMAFEPPTNTSTPAAPLTDIPTLIAQHRGGMSAKQFSEITGIAQGTLYALAKANRIPSVKIGGKAIFDPARVAAWWRSKEAQYNSCSIHRCSCPFMIGSVGVRPILP